MHVVVARMRRQFLAFGNVVKIKVNMEMLRCIFIFTVLWIQGCNMQIDLWTPEFMKVMTQITGTDLEMKIIVENRRIEMRAKAEFHAYSLNEDLPQCHSNLLKMLADDLRCPDLAKTLRPFLDIQEYLQSLQEDKKLLESFVGSNCTILSGKSASTCKLLSSGSWSKFSFEMLISLIDQCRLQYDDREDGSRRALSQRYPMRVCNTFC